jgi:D-methionine transport system permease protein
MNLNAILIKAILQTLYMVSVSTLVAVILGFVLAIILVVTDEKGLKPNKLIYKTLDFVINTLRSFPFIILIVAIIPLTEAIVGTFIGTTAAIVPLSIGAAPFATRVIEASLREIDYGIIEAARSFGATNTQIIFKIMVKEALPSIVMAITLTIISIIGYSAMAGAVGAGGLGDVALTYGYNMFDEKAMISTVVLLIVIVQLLQSVGNLVYKKMTK